MAEHDIDDLPGARAELLCFLVATAAASRFAYARVARGPCRRIAAASGLPGMPL